MALPVGTSGCVYGAAGAALLTLLLLPAPLFQPPELPSPPPSDPAPALTLPTALEWLDAASANCSSLDLYLTVAVLLVATATYLCEWIQRKLMERRILKLNSAVAASSERLRAWQAARRQAAGVLRLARDCTAEYDLLLHLLLRRAPLAPFAPLPLKQEPV